LGAQDEAAEGFRAAGVCEVRVGHGGAGEVRRLYFRFLDFGAIGVWEVDWKGRADTYAIGRYG
jgi:hypothetical protein